VQPVRAVHDFLSHSCYAEEGDHQVCGGRCAEGWGRDTSLCWERVRFLLHYRITAFCSQLGRMMGYDGIAGCIDSGQSDLNGWIDSALWDPGWMMNGLDSWVSSAILSICSIVQ
jgi:hypothetical protein